MLARRRISLAVLALGLPTPALAVTGLLGAAKEATSVAAFPDVAPDDTTRAGSSKPTSEPAEELLGSSPYPADQGHASPETASGGNPYAQELHRRASEFAVANPYVDELRLRTSETVSPEDPYTATAPPDVARPGEPDATAPSLKDPYADVHRDATSSSQTPAGGGPELKNPYGDGHGAAPPAVPTGQLIVETNADFRGIVLIDGLATHRGLPFPVPAGRHTVSVFPREGRPYQVQVYVRAERTERLPVR